METRDQRLARKNQATADYWRRRHEFMNQQAQQAQPRRHIADNPLPPAPDDDDEGILDFDNWGESDGR